LHDSNYTTTIYHFGTLEAKSVTVLAAIALAVLIAPAARSAPAAARPVAPLARVAKPECCLPLCLRRGLSAQRPAARRDWRRQGQRQKAADDEQSQKERRRQFHFSVNKGLLLLQVVEAD
jgi:hypothetical protein